MGTSEAGTFVATLRVLVNKGVRYSTVIDVGSADGHFFLHLYAMGLFPGAVPLNIDANDLYEDSLRAIKAAVGGDFQIVAIADREGETELTTAAHPYWSSLHPQNHSYWARINNLAATARSVPTTTLDSLCKRLRAVPPYLVKLDVQGLEQAALRGATKVLKDTHVLICETDMDDFQGINRIMAENDFLLYDVTDMNRLADGTLGWFYATYVNGQLAHLRPQEFWDKNHNSAIVNAQVQRRALILKQNAEIIAHIQRQKASTKKY